MSLLESISGPADLDGLSDAQLATLAREIRDFLVDKVSRSGGHLGPNLGMVEISLAMHRVFSSPTDKFVFDTGHQAYVHKMLTGRQDGFDKLRQAGGLSGYPSRAESEHDLVENSHASTSLSYADGLAKAFKIRGGKDAERYVVALIGDGGLTGGMAWEALNNIATNSDLRLIIVVNDNGRSYSPTVGGLARHLTTLRTNPKYEQVLDLVRRNLGRTPMVGSAMYDVLHGVKKGLKDVLAPQGMFEDLGLKYIGPVNGHDEPAMEAALRRAKAFGGPVIVHAVTRKGFGYDRAEAFDEDQFHAPAPFVVATGAPVSIPGRGWTDVFADELVAAGKRRADLVAITAAMLYPTGLAPFKELFPDRTFDVGIAEQHAVTSAAGLAMAGLHPVVALYSTFLNRAFDQVLMDVALHRLGVTFVLDRSGVTGSDGASHNGMWDCSILQVVPGLHLAVPRDGRRLSELFAEAIEIDDAPSVVRFPKGELPEEVPATGSYAGMDLLHGRVPNDRRVLEASTPIADVLVVSYGALAPVALDLAGRLEAQGYTATVIDPRWATPVNPALAALAAAHRQVVTIEDSSRVGGCGAALQLALSDAQIVTPISVFGIPPRFLDHGKRDVILTDCGLTGAAIARQITGRLAESTADTAEQISNT